LAIIEVKYVIRRLHVVTSTFQNKTEYDFTTFVYGLDVTVVLCLKLEI